MPTAAAISPSAPVTLESLTISRDAMPHHYIARAVIFDLQPEQMVAAIIATEARIKQTHRYAHRSGWSATSDGLRIYFHEWTQGSYASPVTARRGVQKEAPMKQSVKRIRLKGDLFERVRQVRPIAPLKRRLGTTRSC